jgi:hypothetical protein
LRIGQGEDLAAFFFAQDILRKGGFGALNLADFFLDAVLHEKAARDDFAGLADAVDAINGLHLDGRVPPRVEQSHISAEAAVRA